MKTARRVFDGETWGFEEARPSAPKRTRPTLAEFHNGHRVYCMHGKRFSITAINRPADGEIIYFTDREYTYIREEKLTHEQFLLVWSLKKEDHRYSPVPAAEITAAQETGKRVCQEVLQMFREKSAGKI